MEQRHETKKYTCQFCYKEFYCYNYLRFHLSVHRNSDPDPSLSCRFCPQRFFTLRTKQLHENIHNRLQVWICASCLHLKQKPGGELATSEASLKHCIDRKEYTFACSICSKRFFSSLLRSQHEALHTELQYKCKRCKMVFAQKGALESHMIIHKEKPRIHLCKCCGVRYKTKITLRSHEKKKGLDNASDQTANDESAIKDKEFIEDSDIKIKMEVEVEENCLKLVNDYFVPDQAAPKSTNTATFENSNAPADFLIKSEIKEEANFSEDDSNLIRLTSINSEIKEEANFSITDDGSVSNQILSTSGSSENYFEDPGLEIKIEETIIS